VVSSLVHHRFAFYLLLDHHPTLAAFWVATHRVTIHRRGEPLCNKSLRNGQRSTATNAASRSKINRDQRSLTATTARRVTIWRWDEPLCHKSLRNAQRSTGTNAASPSQQKIPIRTLITNHRDFIVGSSSFAFYLLLDHNPTLEAFWVAARRVTIQRQGEPLCNKSLRNGQISTAINAVSRSKISRDQRSLTATTARRVTIRRWDELLSKSHIAVKHLGNT